MKLDGRRKSNNIEDRRGQRTGGMGKRELKALLEGVTHANITVRNFPLNVAELRKRLHLADGGPHYIFATTLADQRHILILCKKIR